MEGLDAGRAGGAADEGVDRGGAGPGPRGCGRRSSGSGRRRQPGPPKVLSIREQFDQLKGWVSGAYYSTEIGMKELGWNGLVIFDKLPECGPSSPSA